MYINTVFTRRRTGEVVFGIVIFVLGLRFLEPEVKIIKIQPVVVMEALTGEIKYPEWVSSDLGNFEPDKEKPRAGPGERGKAHVLTPDQAHEANATISRYGLNVICSNEISLDRSVPDLRHDECKHWDYPEDLPKVSVVVVFHNEAFSVLMRTVHSILNRTPLRLLEEVLLVDDFSDRMDLGDSLASYLLRWDGKVRLLRNSQREGPVKTKSRGVHEARGEIIVFLDAYCEVNKNWLPPLITPIHNKRTTITVPIIDTIDFNDFRITSVHTGSDHWRGIFDWGLEYRESLTPAKELIGRWHSTEPYRSPTFAGGLFAINKRYFLELGLYDPGLLVSGGENFDLSFKVWQCGGSILFVPCSRVGQVDKKVHTLPEAGVVKKVKENLLIHDYKRVAENWMDGIFKEYFYRRQPSARRIDMGDISEQVKLKEKLQCKSFHWFIENVAYDVLIRSKVPPPNKHWGYLKNNGTSSCLGSYGPVPAAVLAQSCDTIVRLNVLGQLGIGQFCVVYTNNELQSTECPMFTVRGPWEYDDKTSAMRHKDEGKCMEASNKERGHLSVSLFPCNATNANQQWTFVEMEQQ